MSKIGEIKIVYHRAIPKEATIKALTIKKDGGKWFACFSFEIKHTHKQANRLLNDFDIIIHENLNIQGMKRRPKPKQDEEGKYLPNNAGAKGGLNKSISDVSWGKFFEILKYKALIAGKTVIAVDQKYTSQICSGCGNMVNKSLSMRTHICPVCNLVIPRDYNSAIIYKGLGPGVTEHGISRSPRYNPLGFKGNNIRGKDEATWNF